MSGYGFYLSFCAGNPKWRLLLWNKLLIVKFLLFLQRACPAFQQPPVSLKVVSKLPCDPENCSERRLWTYTGKNWPTRAKESQNRSLMAFGTIVRISQLVSVFKEASKNFILNFHFNYGRQAENLPSKKIFNWWHNPFTWKVSAVRTQKVSLCSWAYVCPRTRRKKSHDDRQLWHT